MKFIPDSKTFLYDLLPILVFIILSSIYFYPEFQGKGLELTDVIQSKGANHEAEIYREKGDQVLWTNSSFGGMPVFISSSKNVFHWIHRTLNLLLPQTILLTSLGFIGFYILLLSFGIKRWLAFIGGFAYSMSTYNFLSLEAGHINKIYDMMLMAPVLAGVFLVYRDKIWKGAMVTSIFLGMQIYYGHIQINYYLLIMILGVFILELIKAIKGKELILFVKKSLILGAIAMLSILSNIVFLWSTRDLAPSTTRGGSELTEENNNQDGLDYDYAFAWSNGISESFTLFIPYFMGGGSREQLDTRSNTYMSLIDNGVGRVQANNFIKNIPLYWGDQPFTSGPIYFGAIIVFLFVLGLFIIKSPIKWWILSLAVLSIMLSWGKNFPVLSNLFFYHIPLYDKFRSVTMILSIAELLFPFMAILALNEVLNPIQVKSAELIKKLIWATSIIGGLSLIFFLMGGSLFNFQGPNDASMRLPEWLLTAIEQDRMSKLRMDAFRAFALVTLTGTAIWLYLKGKIKMDYALWSIALLIIFDLWTINKRYINGDDFKDMERIERQSFVPTSADQQILADDDPYFRVYNLTTNTFNEGITSYFHQSLGGYSAIKLQRYQDIIEKHISMGNMKVINMLNTKYLITSDNNNNIIARMNPSALGNCWFVKDYKIVSGPDEEIAELNNINPAVTALVDQKFEINHVGTNIDSTGIISLTSYHPMKLEYTSKSKSEQLAVFSDIYYQPGWESYIDGKKVDHFRVNYILRGLIIPAGDHSIQFEFEPRSYMVGEMIGLSASMAIILIIFLNIFIISFRKENKD